MALLYFALWMVGCNLVALALVVWMWKGVVFVVGKWMCVVLYALMLIGVVDGTEL